MRSQYHVTQTVAALQAGKHVFVEKPMAITLSGADEIAAAAKATNRVVFVGFMRRYSEAFLRVKEIVHAAPKNIQYGECKLPHCRRVDGSARARHHRTCRSELKTRISR